MVVPGMVSPDRPCRQHLAPVLQQDLRGADGPPGQGPVRRRADLAQVPPVGERVPRRLVTVMPWSMG